MADAENTTELQTPETQYQEINDLLDKDNQHYKEGFFTSTEVDTFDKGLSEAVVRAISAKKNEPTWMLDFRLKAFKHWETLEEPHWAKAEYKPLDYQDYSYYSAPTCGSCDGDSDSSADKEIDPEVAKAFAELGVPIMGENANIAVDAIFDSVSVSTNKREDLAELGIIFCSFSEAVQDYPELVQKYMGTVVPYHDNYFAALNSAVASDGTFVYIPENVRCPIDLSTYFRINEAKTGQFERTILVADKGSYVSYLEGCSAPVRDTYQLHAAVVEVVVMDDAEVKYSTVQNWYSG
ncbi:MAG: SufD family Fe-S cluster assembly protein, partial [Thiomicrorhabdus sp.]|nr:SufD family Fe-S cluster assembly protein [Thiomicrorhabdus sp.]